jgi:hypothetical protein
MMAGGTGGSAQTGALSSDVPSSMSAGPDTIEPERAAADPTPSGRLPRVRAWVPDILGVLWVLVAAGAALTPALAHGLSLGNYDLQTFYGLTQQSGVPVHNLQASDQINFFIPFTNLAWTEVHHGHLPLWNPYNALGMPLAFNWESATFSVPALLGYLFPLHLAYTVQVIATLAIAGTGVYVLGRVLGLGVLGCTMAATVYELSGSLFALVGWSFGAVMSWAGWLFVAVILVVRGRHRARAVAFFAVVLACVIYAGEPEGVIFLALAVALYLVVVLGLRIGQRGTSGPIVRPLIDLAVAAVAGAALGAPLLLPGTQVGGLSIRQVRGGQPSYAGIATSAKALPLHNLIGVLFQGFDGLPVAGSRWFSDRFLYIDVAAYVGVIAVVLVVVALIMRGRRPEVLAFALIGVVMGAIVFIGPVVSILDHLPFHLGGVLWFRVLTLLGFALAVLAGVGTDVVVRSGTSRRVRTWLGGAFVAMALVVLALWLFGRGKLPPADATIRAQSFVWPVIGTVVGLGAVAVLLAARRADGPDTRRRSRSGAGTWAAAALVACETAFLVTAGAPIWASSASGLTPTPAVTTLERVVGSSLVGFGTHTCVGFNQLGIRQNVNAAYGVRELASYDPMIPLAYFRSWKAATGQPGGPSGVFIYCPAVTTATMARQYGVGYVLEPHGAPGPRGATFDQTVGDEDLYRIPGAAAATLTSAPSTGALPGVDARGTPVAVTRPGPASWKVVTHAASPQVLRLRITDLPGWHATIDGRPLALSPFAGVMLQARIPAGTHTVELHYWPDDFTDGLVLAGASVVGLGVALFVGRSRRGRSRPRRGRHSRTSTSS